MKGLYEPAEDTFLLLGVVSALSPMGSVVEVGSGTGMISVSVSEKASYTVSTDISIEACRHTLKVLKEAGSHRRSDVVLCDLLTAFREGCIFDTVVSNPPYLPEEYMEDRAIYGGKEGIEVSVELLEQASRRLRAGGRLLMVASSLSEGQSLLDAAERLGFEFRNIKRKRLFFEELSVIEFTKKK